MDMKTAQTRAQQLGRHQWPRWSDALWCKALAQADWPARVAEDPVEDGELVPWGTAAAHWWLSEVLPESAPWSSMGEARWSPSTLGALRSTLEAARVRSEATAAARNREQWPDDLDYCAQRAAQLREAYAQVFAGLLDGLPDDTPAALGSVADIELLVGVEAPGLWLWLWARSA